MAICNKCGNIFKKEGKYEKKCKSCKAKSYVQAGIKRKLLRAKKQ